VGYVCRPAALGLLPPRLAAALAAGAALLAPGLAADAADPDARPAATPIALPPPGGEAWQPLTFRGVKRPTLYTPLSGKDAGARAEARCGASALVLPLEAVDLARTPILHWRWRIVVPLDVSDERVREGDDFAARVTVMFEFEPGEASLYDRMRRALAARLFGAQIPGTALTFVWTSRIPPGSLWPNPYAQESRMISLAQGPGDGWQSESVDLHAFYLRAFDRVPPTARGIGIMTDADDTCRHAVAEYKDFRLAPAEAA